MTRKSVRIDFEDPDHAHSTVNNRLQPVLTKYSTHFRFSRRESHLGMQTKTNSTHKISKLREMNEYERIHSKSATGERREPMGISLDR